MGAEPISLVAGLVEAGSIDTVYRDLYLARARSLLSPVMSLDDFHHGEQRQKGLAELPVALARALEKGDWPQVKELSLRTDALKKVVGDEATRFETARGVYAVTDVTLDPFCQSLQSFTRVADKDLPALQTRIVDRLSTLESSDVPWKDFYAGRRTAFQTRAPIGADPVSGGAAVTSAESVRQAAAEALKSGDMKRLAELADLMPTVTSAAGESAPGSTTQTRQQASQALVASWSSDTLARARQLGLAPRHLEPRADLAALRQ